MIILISWKHAKTISKKVDDNKNVSKETYIDIKNI